MINANLEHFAAFGMILLSSRAIALQSVSMISETMDGYDLLLISGQEVELRGEDAKEFEEQTKKISLQIQFSAQNAQMPRRPRSA